MIRDESGAPEVRKVFISLLDLTSCLKVLLHSIPHFSLHPVHASVIFLSSRMTDLFPKIQPLFLTLSACNSAFL